MLEVAILLLAAGLFLNKIRYKLQQDSETIVLTC